MKPSLFKMGGVKTLSTQLSSLAYDEFNEEKISSLLKVDFSEEIGTLVKSNHSRNFLSRNFTTIGENVVEVGGTIIVSF